jgi:hypothetical protein
MTSRYILGWAVHPSPPLHHLGVLLLLLFCVVLQGLTVAIREFLTELVFAAYQRLGVIGDRSLLAFPPLIPTAPISSDC